MRLARSTIWNRVIGSRNSGPLKRGFFFNNTERNKIDESMFKRILIVPSFQERMKKAKRRVDLMCIVAAGLGTGGLVYFGYPVVALLYCSAFIYIDTTAKSHPVFSFLVHEIWLNIENPNQIYLKTHVEGRFINVSDLEPCGNIQEAYRSLIYKGHDPELVKELKKRNDGSVQALIQNVADERYMVNLKNDCAESIDSYFEGEYKFKHRNDMFVFLLKEKGEYGKAYLVGIPYGYTDALDEVELIRIINGGTFSEGEVVERDSERSDAMNEENSPNKDENNKN